MTQNSVSQVKTKVKVVFLGEQSTGKTSIITRFMTNKFQQGIGPTVGIDFLAKNITVGNFVVRLQLWDTAGQQRFRSLIPNYLKDATVAILVFDLTNRRSFDNLQQWVDLFNEHRKQKAIFLLVGNKQDLTNRQINYEEALKRAKELGLQYFQTSAKTAYNIQNIFYHAGQLIVKDTFSADTSSGIIPKSQNQSKLIEKKQQSKTEEKSQKIQNNEFKNSIKVQEQSKSHKLNNQATDPKKKKKGCC